MSSSNDKIRVLRIINRFNLGGITFNVSYLSRYLADHYTTRLIGGPEEKGEGSSLFIPESLGLKPEVLMEMQRSVNPFSDLKAYWRIRKIMREFKPHIVHTHASKAGALGRLAAYHENVPVVVHTFHGHVFHGYFHPLITSVIKSVERLLARRSDAIVTISQLQKQDICDRHKISSFEKTIVIPLGFDLQRFTADQANKRASFRKKQHIADGELAIGIIGRLAPVKDHRLFLNAFAEVLKQCGRKVRAFIIGDGDLKEELIAYSKSIGLSTAVGTSETAVVTFTGWIREADVALAGCDLVALSSLNEGTPVSLIEAQASGRYIVTTDVGGVRDILHPDCGRTSAPGDLSGFTANLLHAVKEWEKVNALAGSARAEVLEKYSYHRLCSDMDGLYQKLLREKGLIAK